MKLGPDMELLAWATAAIIVIVFLVAIVGSL